MPKQLVEIRGFQNGIVCAPSETDIPLDAAVYSLNIDPVAEGGKLSGIPTDTTVLSGFGGTQMEWVEQNESEKQKALLFYDPTEAQPFAYYNDFNGTRTGPFTIPQSVTTTSDRVAFASDGHSVHAGMGSDQPPKWIGFVQQKQFNVDPPANMTMYDAALDSYSLETNGIYKAVHHSFQSRYLGVEYGGTKIIVVTENTGAIYGTSDSDIPSFTRIQAICKSETTAANTTFMWVYDNDGTTCGTLYEVSYTAGVFAIVKTITIKSWGGQGLEDPGSYTCTDMIQGGGGAKYIWFAIHNLAGGVKITRKRSQDPTDVRPPDSDLSCGYGTLLFRTLAVPSDGQNIETQNMTINLKGTDGSRALTGVFFLENEVDDSYHYFDLITFMKPLMLQAVNSDTICWFCSFKSGTSSAKITTATAGVHQWDRVGLCVYIIAPDMTAGSGAHPIDTGSGTSKIDIRGVRLTNDSDDETSFIDKSITGFQPLLVQEETGADYFINIAIGNGSSTTLYLFDDGKLTLTSNDNFYAGNLTYLEDGSSHTYQKDDVSIGIPHITLSSGYQSILALFIESGGYGYATVPLLDTGVYSTVSYVTLADFIVVPRDTNVRADGMRATRTYRFFVAYEYDGYQIGPLSEALCEHTPSEDGNAVFVDFYFISTEIPNPRITGLTVFRSYYDGLVSTQEDSLPRVIGRIDITTLTKTKKLEGFSTDFYYHTIKDTNSPSETFEELTGYPHTESECTPYYGLSCKGGGQLLVANCGGVGSIKDASSYGFISEVGRFDQFDLYNKFVIFSEVPNALAYWRGRFYGFANSKFWRVSPVGPLIEDEFDGVGCQGPKSVCVSEYGMFVAGTTNLYLDKGQGFEPIGTSILTSDSARLIGWNERDMTFAPVCFFDAKRISFIAVFKKANGDLRAWSYNLQKGRWDLWGHIISSNPITDNLYGDDGEMYVCNGEYLIDYLGGTGSRGISWASRVLDAGMNTIDKKWYKIRIPYQGTNTASVFSAQDQDGNLLTTTNSHESGMYVVEMDALRHRGLQVGLQLEGTQRVDSIGVIYRAFGGVR